jgi:hypothetical protein
MKTYELTYYINVSNDMKEEEIRNFLMFSPHNKKLIKIKEIDFIDVNKL